MWTSRLGTGRFASQSARVLVSAPLGLRALRRRRGSDSFFALLRGCGGRRARSCFLGRSLRLIRTEEVRRMAPARARMYAQTLLQELTLTASQVVRRRAMPSRNSWPASPLLRCRRA
jgi:hypothetical protein